MTRRRAVVVTVGAAAWLWWRWDGRGPSWLAYAVLGVHQFKGRHRRPEPVWSGPPGEALP